MRQVARPSLRQVARPINAGKPEPNPGKTKMLIFSTTQMSTPHNLSSLDMVKININDQYIERNSSWNVPGVELNVFCSVTECTHVLYCVRTMGYPLWGLTGRIFKASPSE